MTQNEHEPNEEAPDDASAADNQDEHDPIEGAIHDASAADNQDEHDPIEGALDDASAADNQDEHDPIEGALDDASAADNQDEHDPIEEAPDDASVAGNQDRLHRQLYWRIVDPLRPYENLVPLILVGFFVLAMAATFFESAVQVMQEGSFYSSPLAAAVIWPFLFAALEYLFNRQADGLPRKGNAKFYVEHQRSDGRYRSSPLDMESLRAKIDLPSVKDAGELPTGFWETSLAIDLIVAALATNVVAILFLLNEKNGLSENDVSFLQTAIFLLAVQFFVLAVIPPVLNRRQSQESGFARIVVTLMSNVTGLGILYVSFLLIATVTRSS